MSACVTVTLTVHWFIVLLVRYIVLRYRRVPFVADVRRSHERCVRCYLCLFIFFSLRRYWCVALLTSAFRYRCVCNRYVKSVPVHCVACASRCVPKSEDHINVTFADTCVFNIVFCFVFILCGVTVWIA